VGSIFVLSLLAMFNPTLLAAVTIMLLLPNPKKLMLGYLLGAYLTSISLGLLIVFSLNGSGGVETARHTLSPVEDLVVGAIALLVAFVLGTGRTARLQERRRQRKEEKEAKAGKGGPKLSLPERMLGRGDARITFAVGVLLTFPGVSYLAALDKMADLDAGTAPTVLLVVVFCLIQQMLLELPLIGYALAPDWTQGAVVRFRAWLGRNGRRGAAGLAAFVGVFLLVRGLVTLLG
jgi:hypothetical protein